LDCTGRDNIAEADNTHSFDCQPEQHVRAVGDNRAFDIHLDPFAVDPKRPRCGAGNVAQSQACMLRKIGRLD